MAAILEKSINHNISLTAALILKKFGMVTRIESLDAIGC